MFNLDFTKIMIILLVALVLLGPDKLPEAARQIGSFWKSFQDFRGNVESTLRETIPDMPSTTEMARMVRSPVAMLNKLADFDTASNPVREDPEAAPIEAPLDALRPDPSAPEVANDEVVIEHLERPERTYGDPSLN